MPTILKGRSPALIFGTTFAIGLLLLAGAALVTALSSGPSEEQRASQAAHTAFGGYHEVLIDVPLMFPPGQPGPYRSPHLCRD